MLTIGFLVNPIAGMGGAVGLKGTDGLLSEAVRLGATSRASHRAKEAILRLKGVPLRFLTCSGSMGEQVLREAGIGDFEVVYTLSSPESSADDTRRACIEFRRKGAGLILFCGGDGTARDVYDAVGDGVPILGIPAGVKMYSAVFAVTPGAAAGVLIHSAVMGNPLHLRDAEVVDVDEDAYRHGELRARLYGYAKSPYRPGLVQSAKQVFEDQDEQRAKAGIARFISEVMEGTPDILYILGPGSTTEAIAEEIGINKTLLGFDAVRAGNLVAADLNEKAMLKMLDDYTRARLVVSIIGAQGSLLGRGTQQVSPEVLRRIGVGNIIVVATPHKLAETPLIFVDSGDPAIDQAFGDFVQVISGYRTAQRKRVSWEAQNAP